MKPCDRNLNDTLELAERMIALSFQGDADREDNGCGILYGVMRDAGYRLREMAHREVQQHHRKNRHPGAVDANSGPAMKRGGP